MYSLLLLLLFFIAQIAASEALVHGHYPRFNRVDNPNIQWMTNAVRHTRHGPIYRSVPDPTPNSQGTVKFGTGSFVFDFNALKDPLFMSKALVSAVLLVYFAIALGYAIRYHRRKLHSPGLDATRFSTCCEPSCADYNEFHFSFLSLDPCLVNECPRSRKL
ncbi:hypothetical protein BDM02DRAFT_1223093 [Thelephora ganbajun]|uniref:Uncharacterized protein n=1 Tax=Thelephora ganbajun TaxID=370292 RepID=A0ACB6ZNA2_THEGA|nr:hypothetical protein BDM02DRAFT_1223093 [Thelephora ganbajun]